MVRLRPAPGYHLEQTLPLGTRAAARDASLADKHPLPRATRLDRPGQHAVRRPFRERDHQRCGFRIDPNVDEAQIDLVQDMIYSQHLAKLGFYRGCRSGDESAPRETSAGGTYYTDGLRAVLFFENRPVSISQIQFLPGSASSITTANRSTGTTAQTRREAPGFF